MVRGTRVSAAARRRYFAIGSAGGLGLLLVLAVFAGPESTGQAAAHRPAALGVTAPNAATTVPSQDREAAKLAAQSNGAANPVTDTVGAQALPQQPSWNAAPQVVRYHGYQFQVPSSWPVYNLATDPSRCVLLTTHAVYLGTPGNDQDCPAAAVGRTEALLIQPASSARIPAATIVLAGGSAALSQHVALPPSSATTHMFQVEVPKAGVLITATYSVNEPRLRAILAAATIVSQAAAPGTGSRSSGSGSSGSGSGSSGSSALGGPAVSGPSSTATQSVTTVAAKLLTSTATSGQTSRTSQLAPMIGSGLGLDTCTVPSISAMGSWLASPYRVIGTYLGGMNWGCTYGNFSASWVRHAAAEGWRFVPIWVGRQAPCSTNPGVTVIDPPHAAAEGQADAGAAVAAAREFGYGRGAPIYFDMEGYLPSPGCSSAVKNFLQGWTQALHADGYASGVYSSAASGISGLVAMYKSGGCPCPNSIWIADWDGEQVLTDSSVPSELWANHQRLHQFSGPHDEKWGGVTLNIDSDAVDGLVVGMPAVPDTPRPAEDVLPSELNVAPGSTAQVQLVLQGVPRTPADVQWRVDVPHGMSAAPGYGTVYLWPGASYSVSVSLTPSSRLAPGRYLVPITVTSGSHAITDAFVLVSVVRQGNSLATPYPVVLYAADPTDAAIAARISGTLALPQGDVTGSFSQAWRDAASNKDLVLAVGQAAANALYFNVCGWTDPAGLPAGSSPFYYPGYQLKKPPGRSYFELASTRTEAGTTLLATQLTQYALAGTLPNYGSTPVAPTPPTLSCLGTANVRIP